MKRKITKGKHDKVKKVPGYSCPRCKGRLVVLGGNLQEHPYVHCVSCGWVGGLFEAAPLPSKWRPPSDEG